MAEGFPCSVAGLMAVPLSLVTHETRAYAQAPLANHSLERERPSTDQAAALNDQRSLIGYAHSEESQAEALHPERLPRDSYFWGSCAPSAGLWAPRTPYKKGP